MRDSLPWSPLDFIRGISPSGDRQVHVDPLLRPLPPEDDFRILCPLGSATEVAVCAERLPWDSSFFGYGVARLQGIFPLAGGSYSPDADYGPAIAALVRLARARGIRYLFAVVDSRDLPTTRALTAEGFALIETRLCFHRAIRSYHHARRFRCRVAREADVEALTQLAHRIENPFDRFNADPFIDRDAARRLMETWIRASIVQGFADATIVPDTATPAAFCTLKYHRDREAVWGRSIAQMMLAMSEPGTGTWLVGVISELAYHLKEMNVDHVFFTTQIANRSAIRVAEHCGFTFGRGEYVFRLLL
jgi:RimJ/RimL family protein N-acetyltransferase